MQAEFADRLNSDWHNRIEPDWPDLKPVPDRPPVPTMPLEQLPDCFRDWVADCADRAQMPAEMVAVPAIVAAGSLIGRALAIQPKRRDTGWIEFANVWGLTIARPGAMKSVGLGEGVQHVVEIARRERRRHDEDRIRREAALRVLDLELEQATKRGRGAASDGEDLESTRDAIADIERRRDELMKPARRLITQDSTVEKLAELIHENPRGILLCRDELSGWFEVLGKSGREGSRAFFLEAWSGKVSHAVDRIGRGSLHVPPACIAVLGTIQPDKLRSVVGAASGEGGDGLIQRFSIAVWPDAPTEWRSVDRVPDGSATERARRVFDALDRMDADHLADDGAAIPRVTFTAEAQELFEGWQFDLETNVRSDEMARTPALEGHLSKYRKLVPAIALICHVAERADAGESPMAPIGIDSARRAAAWSEYLEQHARRIYGAYDPEHLAARALAKRIEDGFVLDGMPVREVYQQRWSRLGSADAATGACSRLAELGWLRLFEKRGSGRPSPVIHLHPDVIDRQRGRHG